MKPIMHEDRTEFATDSRRHRSTRWRIRQAWQVLRGKNDFLDAFALGMDAGQYMSWSLYQKYGVVLNPFAAVTDQSQQQPEAQQSGPST